MSDAATSTVLRFDSAVQEAFLNLWRTYDRLRALEDDLFARFDLTPQQYNALRVLKASHPEPLPTLAVADRLVSRAPDITRMIDKLEARGWVARERPANDRRTVLVAIRQAGLRLLQRIAGPLQATHEQQLGHLTAEDLQTLNGLLREARRPHEADDSPWR